MAADLVTVPEAVTHSQETASAGECVPLLLCESLKRLEIGQ